MKTILMYTKAFTMQEGKDLGERLGRVAASVDETGKKKFLIVDHPPTAGLVPLIEGLLAAGAEVHLRDHHADTDRNGQIVARCRELLGKNAVITTRAEHPSCSTLVEVGEFAGEFIIADSDMDGVTAAMKASGVSYPELDMDAAILDGPASGKTAEALSPLGFRFVQAWGAIPALGDRNRDRVLTQVVEAFTSAAQGEQSGFDVLDTLAVEYERKVETSKSLAKTAELLAPKLRFLVVPEGVNFDPPTLANELDRDMFVSGRQVTTGPIVKVFGSQISLARTKAGESIDLAALAAQVFGARPEAGWKPEDGIISNTPFLLHLSPERWEAFRGVLIEALAQA
jgi:hypothetical protein